MFSNEAVAKLVNDSFISAWTNRSPKTKFKDGLYQKLDARTVDTYALGNGVTNITAVFALPDGTVLNAVPGYLDAAAFEVEVKFALELRDKVTDAKGRLKEGGAKVIAEAHRARSKDGRGPFTAMSHRKLAEAGLLTLDKVGADYFKEFAPGKTG